MVSLNLRTSTLERPGGVKWNLIGFFNLKLKLWSNQNETFSTCSNNNNNNNNMTLFNEGNIIYWLPSSLQYGPP